MKMSRKILIITLIVALGLAFLGLVNRQQVLKYAVKAGLEQTLGVKAEVGDLFWDTANRNMQLKELKLYNPKGFPRGVFLDIARISIDYDFSDFLEGGGVRLPLLIINLKELTVVKREDGQMNVDELKPVKSSSKQAAINKKAGIQKPPLVQIEKFGFSIGRVVYQDYTRGTPAAIKIYDLNIKETVYNNIPGVQAMIVLLLREAMSKTAIRGAVVYGLATAAGAGFWPVGVAAIIVGKDSSSGNFQVTAARAYQSSLEVIKSLGRITSQDKKSRIEAEVEGYRVKVLITPNPDKTTQINVTARKFLIPRPNFAKNLLYRISERFKSQ